MSNVIDTKENLEKITRIPSTNILFIEKDTGKMKIGNNKDTYKTLEYLSSGVDIATLNTFGISKPDGETIVIDNGVLKSRNIPFDTGNIGLINGTINNIITTQQEDNLNKYMFSNDKYTKTDLDKINVYIENDEIVFRSSGYYFFHLETAFNPNVENTNVTVIAYLNNVGFTADSKPIQSILPNPDFINLNTISYINSGDKLKIGYIETTGKKISPVSLGIKLFKIPITNEYQIQNAIYSGIYTTTANPYIIQTDGGKVELTLPSNSVQENSDLIELTSSGRAKIKKSGIYFVKYTCTLTMSDQGQLYDTNLVMYRFNALNQTTDNIAETSWLVSEQSINPNTGTIYTVCPFSKGDEVFVEFSFPVAETFYLTVSSNFCLFPSVTDNIQSTASTTKAGLVQLATEDQALIGTETNTALTPATGSKMAAHMAMPSNNIINISISGLQEDGSFITTAPDDGYFLVYGSCNRAELTGMSLSSSNTGIGSLYHTSSIGQEVNLFIPVSKGNQVRCFIGSLENWSNLQLKFTYANGSVSEE